VRAVRLLSVLFAEIVCTQRTSVNGKYTGVVSFVRKDNVVGGHTKYDPVIVTNCDPTVAKLVGDDAFTVTFVTWNAFTYTNDIELLFCPATRTDAEYGTFCAMFDEPHRATLAVK